MSPQSFHKLVGLIRNDLEPKKVIVERITLILKLRS